MFNFVLWLVGCCFYAVLGVAIYSVSPFLFWVLAIGGTIRAFINAGPLTQKSRHAARRKQNQLDSIISN